MATLTSALLPRLRRKVDDEAETAWTDNELNDIYDEAGGDWNLTIALCFEELMVNASKFADYRQNESEEKRSQIFANLGKLATYYRNLSNTTQSVRVVGMKHRPPRNKRKPRGWSSW